MSPHCLLEALLSVDVGHHCMYCILEPVDLHVVVPDDVSVLLYDLLHGFLSRAQVVNHKAE